MTWACVKKSPGKIWCYATWPIWQYTLFCIDFIDFVNLYTTIGPYKETLELEMSLYYRDSETGASGFSPQNCEESNQSNANLD